MKQHKKQTARSKLPRRATSTPPAKNPSGQQAHIVAHPSRVPIPRGDGSDRLDRVKTKFVFMLTAVRLLKTITDLTEMLKEKVEVDIASKKAEDAGFRTLCDKLAKAPTVKTHVGSTEAAVAKHLAGMISKRPDASNELSLITTSLVSAFEPMRCLGKLIGCPVLSELNLSMSDFLRYHGVMPRILNTAQDALTKWWSTSKAVWESGVFKVRHPAARHEVYNKEGISLFCILHEITHALELGRSLPAFVEGIKYWDNMKKQDWVDGIPPQLPMVNRLCCSKNTIEDPEDVQRLVFIRQYPSALLFSPEHQDAVARWQYTARCGSATDSKKAQEFLRLSRLARSTAGRRKMHRIDLRQLRQVHDDLSLYIKNLNDALRKSHDVAAVRRAFPDCDFLYMNPSTGKPDERDIDGLFRWRGRDGLPQPAGTAIDFIARHTNMTKGVIYELLAAANRTKSA